jgi:hypothetical protein
MTLLSHLKAIQYLTLNPSQQLKSVFWLLYQQQQQQQEEEQEQEQEQQDAENPFLDPPFSRIKKLFILSSRFHIWITAHQQQTVGLCLFTRLPCTLLIIVSDPPTLSSQYYLLGWAKTFSCSNQLSGNRQQQQQQLPTQPLPVGALCMRQQQQQRGGHERGY